MMNLRRLYIPDGDTANFSLHLSRFSNFRFPNTVVDNLGAPLDSEEEEGINTRRLEGEVGRGADIYNDFEVFMLDLASASDDTLSLVPEEAVVR